MALLEQRKVVEFKLKTATTTKLIELKRRSWILKYTSEGAYVISFNFVQSLFYFLCKILMNVCGYISGAIMMDENNWRCTICDYKGRFRQGDTIGVHMKEAIHMQSTKKKDVVSRGSNQLTIVASLAKEVRSRAAKYPPSFIPNPIDIPHHILLGYIGKNICHGFYKKSLVIMNEVVDCNLLLYDPHVRTL